MEIIRSTVSVKIEKLLYLPSMKQSVIALILSKDESSFLAIKRRDVLMWVLPGGGIEEGESPETAVIREVKEETGLSVEIVRKGAEYFPISKLANLTHVFVCKPIQGGLERGSETADIGYFSTDALPTPFFHIHLGWILEMINSPTQIIRRNLDEVTPLSFILYFLRHPINVIRFSLSRLGFPINCSKSRRN